MNCPYCSHEDTKVLESRYINESTRRRRECLKCEKRFTTYERVENVPLTVQKKDGTKESFIREKVRGGIQKACWKRPVTPEQIEVAVNDIEKSLRQEDDTTISSTKIGDFIMRRLKKLDKVAFIRFASVYKEFDDVESFTKEIEKLK